MYEECPERQKDVARCDLLGLPWPLHGHILAELATCSGENVDGISGVQIGPGATPLTRMPFSTSASDRERVNATIAPFVDA